MNYSASIFLALLCFIPAIATADKITCNYHGYDFEVGDTFPSATDCNQCMCGEGGVGCTQMGCGSYQRLRKYGPFCSSETKRAQGRLCISGECNSTLQLKSRKRVFFEIGTLALVDPGERADDHSTRGEAAYEDGKGRSLMGPDEIIYGDVNAEELRIRTPEVMKICICEAEDKITCSDAKRKSEVEVQYKNYKFALKPGAKIVDLFVEADFKTMNDCEFNMGVGIWEYGKRKFKARPTVGDFALGCKKLTRERTVQLKGNTLIPLEQKIKAGGGDIEIQFPSTVAEEKYGSLTVTRVFHQSR